MYGTGEAEKIRGERKGKGKKEKEKEKTHQVRERAMLGWGGWWGWGGEITKNLGEVLGAS